MRVAVAGCCHGELDKIYETLALAERRGPGPVDLLLCCGDFQAVRNEADLRCMAVPPKYRHMQTFYRYYSGEKKAPVLTVFIGGNHEASNHLQELPYGGWVAPNIYYLGLAGVVKYRGVRIGGISGIFKSHDYRKGHFEYPPYNPSTIRSIYHVRNIEVYKLKQLKQPIDIFLSHDWPRSIYHYGNKKQLLKTKSFFRQEVENNTLGSPAASELLEHLKPTYWFSAHLHVKFAALMQHQAEEKGQTAKATKFLALDKCLPHRDFLQVLEIEHDPSAPDYLEYDIEWLTILKATDNLINVTGSLWNMPENNGLHTKWDYSATEEAMKEVLEKLNHDLRVPCNFSVTAACYDPNKPQTQMQLVHRINPQTTEFCAQLGITDINVSLQKAKGEHHLCGEYEEQDDVESNDSGGDRSEYNTDTSALSSINPDEIMLDEEEEDDDNIVSAHSDSNTPSIEPSSNQGSDFSASFSDIRILPGSMIVSSDDTSGSPTDREGKLDEAVELENEKDLTEMPLKRRSDEHEPEQRKKIKRRNQAIYAAMDDDDDDA
ncbi:lariat debranching enzyme isoform X1 [Ictidomys tridecemlineatus]|uniref:Lariat debranching enzyme n=1 Tax=Ictidomys tridecemlineatus TaxID=43179 RepID=I3M951_ICTTR|nr:lariat debranching enzyme isoform X1 [Ictidomys tridecemlineatus]KAG3270717.1 debranching RNA lariats 1, transcript variant X1 [Ictidomys tridecemlineatus]